MEHLQTRAIHENSNAMENTRFNLLTTMGMLIVIRELLEMKMVI